MENHKIYDKMKRFTELSTKFTKNEADLFSKDDDNNVNYINSVSCGSGISGTINVTCIDGREIYVDKDGVLKAKDSKPLSRGENIKAKAEIEALLSDEFDEYIELQKSLNNYFNGIDNLIS